jgi:putative flippase GtrA
MEKIKALIKKLWNFTFKTEQGLYLVFGGLTTLVSIITFGFFDFIFAGEHYTVSIVLSNIAGIVFAYFTNRIFVFKSENNSKKAKSQEAVLFFATRTATLFFDLWFTTLLIEKAGFLHMVSKVISVIIVIILNYIASKLYIFTRKD